MENCNYVQMIGGGKCYTCGQPYDSAMKCGCTKHCTITYVSGFHDASSILITKEMNEFIDQFGRKWVRQAEGE